jgi:hypothetical protein
VKPGCDTLTDAPCLPLLPLPLPRPTPPPLPPKVRVALISINAGGVGLTLTAADKVVFAELFWTPSSLLQARSQSGRAGGPQALLRPPACPLLEATSAAAGIMPAPSHSSISLPQAEDRAHRVGQEHPVSIYCEPWGRGRGRSGQQQARELF